MDTLLQDVRYAARSLRRTPLYAAVAVGCLALGIGVNTAIFSMVHGVLFRALPFPDADRVVSLQSTNSQRGITEGGLTYADLADLSAAGVFAELGGLAGRSFTLTGGDESERVQGSSVTPNLFPLLGATPKLGRSFAAEEAAPAGFESVVLLSDALWRRRYAADPGIVGRSIHLNGRELTVVGVMAEGFRFPETDELWVPLGSVDAEDRVRRWIWGIGRLRPDVTMEAAREQLRAQAARLADAHPASHRGWSLRLLPYRDVIIDAPAQRLLYVMLGAVAFVLLIACANVANLMLARAADRELEISVRAALGASRARVLGQLLTESLLIAGAGAVLGVLIAAWTVDAFVSRFPEELAYWIDVGVDGTVLSYTAALAVLTALLFGGFPALQASRADVHGALKQGARGTDDPGRSRFRSALVMGEIALSVVLLAGAGLMVQSFLRMQAADPGFDTGRMLSLRVVLAGDRYDPGIAKATFFQTAVERIARLPGVAGAAATSAIPADDTGPTVTVVAEHDVRSEETATVATMHASTAGFFDALGVDLLAGRRFTRHETLDTSAVVAIVGRTLAERLWPDADAVGRRLRIGAEDWYTVIGVAPDVFYSEFGEQTEQDRLQVHVPYAPAGWRGMAFLVRGTGDPALLATPVRDELRALDPLLAPFDVLTMAERRRFTTWQQRLFGLLFGAFGVIAAVLALAGVYGVMAYSVARRRREIGVRIALGARPGDVLGLVLRRAIRIAVVGLAVGVPAALAVTRLLGSLVWGVSFTDPLVFVGGPLLLGGAALLASWAPALRASRLDPMAALRSE